jgi:rubredoxin
MSDRTIAFSHFTAEQKNEFKRLTGTPKLAWPTFCMWIALNVAFFSSFIPSRMIFLTLGFGFFWLPHVPYDVEQEHNFTGATRFEDIPDDWICPECGAAKSDYELIE